MKNEKKSVRVRFPLGLKFALIMGILVLASLLTVSLYNSYSFEHDMQRTEESKNFELNTRSATSVDSRITTIRSNVFQLLDLLNVINGGRNSAIAKQAEAFFFERNADIAAIQIISEDSLTTNNVSDVQIINNRFFISNEVETSALTKFLTNNQTAIKRGCDGETIALNVSPYFEIQAMALLFPWKENGRNQVCIITFSIETIADALSSNSTDSPNVTFLINDSADLLSYPESDRVIMGENFLNHPLVQLMRAENASGDSRMQINFMDTNAEGKEEQYYGAFQKLSFGDMVIFTTVPSSVAMEAVNRIRNQNTYITLITLFSTIIIVLFWVRYGISRHLRKLTEATDEIQKGNFDTKLIDKLNSRRKDEIGVLNQSTKNERDFLNTFAKFTNQNVAKGIATGSLDFNPHLKDITIFFSDIRGFTAISDGFKNRFGADSGAEIIGFLNDYMSRMVECVELSHGNIDKFEGDAIMAVWGILRDDDLSFEELPDSDPTKAEKTAEHNAHILEDITNAISGTIAMRYALMKYNKDAEAFTKAHEGEEKAKYKPHVRIGCGINSGRASVGLMGSKDKMEYTSIGDPVNFASRTEASNKPCGTDILITEDCYALLKGKYIRDKDSNYEIPKENEDKEIVVEMIPVEFEVKGKGAQHFYGVVNMPKFDIEGFFKQGDENFTADPDCIKAVGPTGPKTLNEMRTMLGIPIPDFEKVNLNEEENKIQVKQ